MSEEEAGPRRRILQVRVTDTERDAAHREADAAGMTISELCRRLLLGDGPCEALARRQIAREEAMDEID